MTGHVSNGVPAVVGLDLSSSCTGVCWPDGSTQHITIPSGTRLWKAQEVRDRITPVVEGADFVVIEDLFTSNRPVQANAVIPLAYVHCQVEARLVALRLRFRRYSNGQIKKFATGSGNANKNQVMIAAQKNGWDPPNDATDDESDAWWMWALGRHLLGAPVVEPTTFRREIVANVLRSAVAP